MLASSPMLADVVLRIELKLTSALSLASDAYGVIEGDEAYELVLAEEGTMRIYSATARGLYYGSRTALKLVGRREGIPLVRIVDGPVSQYRGVMIDNVRQPHSFAFHMEMLERMAAVHLNVRLFRRLKRAERPRARSCATS